MKTPSAEETTSAQTAPVRAINLSGLPWRSFLLLLGTGFVALGPLTPTWNSNPNYSFGWLIPVVCMVLFAERWSTRPLRRADGSFGLTVRLAIWSLLFFAFRLAAETDPDWRPGLWILVSLYVVALLGWLWLEGGPAWVRHFAFPVGFLFLCLPWLFEIEYPLVQGLMRWNAVLVANSLEWIGISAEPAGNIIQMEKCKLGVEEACSGILSLQASLVMGCLLGDIYRLTVRNRFLLVLTSMLLALLGNYLRTFFLALMAFYSGPEAVPEWHDTAGYAILVFTAVGSWMAALWYGGMNAPVLSADGPAARDEAPERGRALRFAVVVFVIALCSELITQAWFGWKESNLIQHPTWAAKLPTTNATYKPVVMSDVTLTALRCDQSDAAQWNDERGWGWNVYWLRYEPKPYTRVVLGWHIPERCLPSVGLTKDADYPDFTAKINGFDFKVHPTKFVSKSAAVYVFWLVYPLRGDLPPGTYNPANVPVSSKIRTHLDDIRNGYRGVGVETLEIAITGPRNYDDAKAAYLDGLNLIVAPGPSPTK